jgi:alpha,alpha-trehalase
MSCFSPIYCYGDLLKTVQLANVYSDSKTFVDKKQRQSPAETLQLFEDFMAQTGGKPDRDQVQGAPEICVRNWRKTK